MAGELSRPLLEEAGIGLGEWIDRNDVFADEAEIFELLRDFAAGTELADIGWAPEVVLAAGPIPAAVHSPAELSDPATWELEVPFFRGRDDEPVSILSSLNRGSWAPPVVGPHPHCASPPMRAPAALSGLRRVSIQRSGIDSCLAWGTVDLFINVDGEVAGVSVDFWEP